MLGSGQAQSGSGTLTPAANAARSTANSSIRVRLDGIPVAASVRRTSCCSPCSRPPVKRAVKPQFSWIAPPGSNCGSLTPTFFAPLASARKRASNTRSNGGNAVAAIDRDDRAGHIGTRRRRQEQQGAVEVRRLSDALQRDAVDQILAGLGLEEFAVEVGLDIARRQRVDEDAVARQLHCQHMGEM